MEEYYTSYPSWDRPAQKAPPPVFNAGSAPMTPPGSSGNTPLDMLPVGMAYTPMQRWTDVYEADQGFQRGTIFRQLDLPFTGGATQ